MSARPVRNTPAEYEAEIRRLQESLRPVRMQKELDRYKIIATLCLALLGGGFGAATWLYQTFASKAEVVQVAEDRDKLERNVDRLTSNVGSLTVNMAKMTTVMTASGKLQDETRKDIRDLREEIRLPDNARLRRLPGRGESVTFEQALEAAKLEQLPLERPR